MSKTHPKDFTWIRETRERKVRIRIEKPRSVVFLISGNTALGGNFMGLYRSKISLVVAALLSTPVVADAADISRGAFYPTSYVPSQASEAPQAALCTGS